MVNPIVVVVAVAAEGEEVIVVGLVGYLVIVVEGNFEKE